jgi:hypothetical protein
MNRASQHIEKPKNQEKPGTVTGFPTILPQFTQLKGACQRRRQDLLRSCGTPTVLLPSSPTAAGPAAAGHTMPRGNGDAAETYDYKQVQLLTDDTIFRMILATISTSRSGAREKCRQTPKRRRHNRLPLGGAARRRRSGHILRAEQARDRSARPHLVVTGSPDPSTQALAAARGEGSSTANRHASAGGVKDITDRGGDWRVVWRVSR